MFIHSVSVEISRFCAGFSSSSGSVGLLSDPVAPFLEETFGVPVRVGSSSLFMVEFCLTLFLSFPGCSHPGLVGAPSPRFDFTGLVAWSLLAPRSWKPPSQSTPFTRSVVLWRWCGADYSLPLISSLIAALFG